MVILALVVGDLDQDLVKPSPADAARIVSGLQEVLLDSVFVVCARYNLSWTCSKDVSRGGTTRSIIYQDHFDKQNANAPQYSNCICFITSSDRRTGWCACDKRRAYPQQSQCRYIAKLRGALALRTLTVPCTSTLIFHNWNAVTFTVLLHVF